MGWFRRTQPSGQGEPPSAESRLARISPGVPGRCPACDGLGYIDSIDIGHRYQIQHCKDCQHRWEYLFDADGAVVGLTELDPAGRPLSRSRVRPLHAAVPPEPEDDVVLDLRDPAPPVEAVADDARSPEVEPAPAGTDPEHLSPAEWLRRSMPR